MAIASFYNSGMRALGRVGKSLKRRLALRYLKVLTFQVNLYTRFFSPVVSKRIFLFHELLIWIQNDFQIPSPPEVKRKVLKSNGIPGVNWIETGTYLGETSFYLSRYFNHVTTLEPNSELHSRAEKKFKKIKNISFILGASETKFDEIMQKHSGSVNIFLDGHYSGGITSKTTHPTPLKEEINIVLNHLERFDEIRLFIDDVRCMNPEIEDYIEYPSLSYVLKRLESFSSNISIQHDILCVTLLRSN
jgi:hypothetical protein